MVLEDSQTWTKDSILKAEQGLIVYTPVDDESRTVHENQQRWFDNPRCQRQDLYESLHYSRISNAQVMRIHGMAHSARLQFWQPPIFKAIDEVSKSDATRGCILADVVGIERLRRWSGSFYM